MKREMAGERPSKHAAAQLWEQVFARMAQSEHATLVDVEHDDSEDEARFREALAQAGWPEGEIEWRVRLHQEQIAGAPTTSPGVNPHVEMLFGRLCDDIEAAMDRLHMDSHARVVRGIEPRVGPLVGLTNVVMTDQSIVTVGSFLFRFCGLVARAFTRTLSIAPFLWESASYSKETARRYLRAEPQLILYWLSIYVSFSVTGTHFMTPYRPAKRSEVLLFEQVARAMEIFAIAHEYGHHHLSHGRRLEDDPKSEEFAADQFALKIAYEVERKPLLLDNPYLSSGAGGVVLLIALETLRRVREVVTGVRAMTSETHPDIASRIARFDSVALLKPREFVALKNFRKVSAQVMETAEAEMSALLHAIPPDLHRRLRELSQACGGQ